MNILVPFLKLKTIFLVHQTIFQITYHLKKFLDQNKGNDITQRKSKLNRRFCNRSQKHILVSFMQYSRSIKFKNPDFFLSCCFLSSNCIIRHWWLLSIALVVLIIFILVQRLLSGQFSIDDFSLELILLFL